MSRALVAGVDVGTTNIKVGMFDAVGACVAMTGAPTPGTVSELAARTIRGLRECVARAGRTPVAVGVASMAETGAALDAAGQALTPLIPWTDPRGAAEAERLNRQCGAEHVYATTGRWATAKSPLAKWLWLRGNNPSIVDSMACWGNVADLVVCALTGSVCTHPTLAARTLAFRQERGGYDADLLALVGLRESQMAPLTAFDGTAGKVSQAAATETGLAAGTSVVNAGHDHTVGAWAAGVRRPGESCFSLGTAEAVVLRTDGGFRPAVALAHGLTTDLSVDGEGRFLVGGLPTSGALVDWQLDMLGGEHPLTDRYTRLRALLDKAGPLPTGILVLPYLRGRVAPQPDPEARLAISGMTQRHGPGDLLAAVIEGTCLHGRWMLDVASNIAGHAVQRLVLLGGQTRIPQWMRIKAALAPAPTAITETPDAVCAGAALRAAQAIGLVRDAPVLPAVPVVPEPELAAAYQPWYRDFRQKTGQHNEYETIGTQR